MNGPMQMSNRNDSIRGYLL